MDLQYLSHPLSHQSHLMPTTATLKGKKDVHGRRKVYIRISNRNYRKFYATDIKIEPKYWKKKVVSHPRAKELNDQIKNLILKYENSPLRPTISFKSYWLSCLSEWESYKKPETIRQIHGELTKFSKFSQPLLSRVNLELLNKYKSYCRSKGNSNNTLWKSFKCLRTIISKAFREGLISENPFALFEFPKYKDPPKTFLSRDQVIEIDKFSRSAPLELKIAATWFVIGCYTGLRYGDQATFNKGKIKDGRLIIYTSKTGTPVSIKLNDKLKELFERVNYKPVPYTNTHYNRLLKAISGELGLPPLSAHQSRHTFATMCASAGISPEVTAKMMGITNLKTVQIYYQITGVRLDSEMEKLF